MKADIEVRPSLAVEYIPGPNSKEAGYSFTVEPVITDAAIPLLARIFFWIAALLRRLSR